MPYANYDYAAIYTEDLPLSIYGELIEPDVKCLQKTKTTKSGQMIEIESFPSFLNRKDYSRARKYKPSSAEQKNLNEKNARRKVIRKINANFTRDDLWGTFGWDNKRQPSSIEEAYRIVDNWINRVNYHGKKDNLPLLKYIYTIEQKEGNPVKDEPPIKFHMHIVMDGLHDRDQLEKLWDGGEYPQTRRLKIKDFGGLTGMATYIAKNPDGKKRWRQSRGLKPWTHKPTFSYSRIEKAKIKKIVEIARSGDSMKAMFEQLYKGYFYSDAFPCEIKHNDKIGGYFLYCRMYKNQFCDDSQPKHKSGKLFGRK